MQVFLNRKKKIQININRSLPYHWNSIFQANKCIFRVRNVQRNREKKMMNAESGPCRAYTPIHDMINCKRLLLPFGKTRTWIRIHEVRPRNKCSTYQQREAKPADGTECAKGNIFYIFFVYTFLHTKFIILSVEARASGCCSRAARVLCFNYTIVYV